jgi:hypothetical protein
MWRVPSGLSGRGATIAPFQNHHSHLVPSRTQKASSDIERRIVIKILAIDIETKPTLAYVWRPYKENVGVDQIVEAGGVISFAAKWVNEKGIQFFSEFHDGHKTMVEEAWRLLDEAEVVLHYNGRKFDVPHLQREFMQAGLTPTSPFKQIDLLNTVKSQARFFMNRLAHVAPQLGLKGKVEHEGFPLWLKCMEGDESAWKRMKKYNIRDVTELEDLYNLLLPWIPSLPSYAAFTGEAVCPKCGSNDLRPDGYAYTNQSKFRRFQCKSCGGYHRSTKAESVVKVTQIAS